MAKKKSKKANKKKSTPDVMSSEGGKKFHDIGILFVHGIGNQPEGDTLLAFGEPLLEWIKRWLSRQDEGAASGELEIVDAQLTPSKMGHPAPAHAEVQMRVTANGRSYKQSWLIAESWWGGEIQSPSFAKLAGWMLTVGAWMILSHTTKWTYAYESKAARVIVQTLALVLSLPFALMLQFIVIALSVLAVLPIPKLRGALSNILLTLTGVLGDSYVLVESDLQRLTIVNKVRSTLVWLGKACNQIIVVAHSQGAAVAHHALRIAQPRNVSRLLTFGSGLGKLEELLRARQAPRWVRGTARIVPVLFLLAGLIVYILLYEQADRLSQYAVALLGIMVFFAMVFVFLSVRNHWANFGRWVEELSLRSVRPKLKWLDVYASHDPVSNGPLAPRGVSVTGVISKEVVNLRSWFRDHTSYWLNRTEFIPYVIGTISDAANLPLFAQEDTKRLKKTAVMHRRNVRWLQATRWATWLSVGILFWNFWEFLHAEGLATLETLAKLSPNVKPLLQQFNTGIGFLFPFLERNTISNVGLRILGAGISLLLIVGWRYGFRFVWRWWDNIAIERVFRPFYLLAWADRAIINLVVFVAGFAPLFVVCAFPYIKDISIGHVLPRVFLILYALMLIFIIGQFTIKSPELLAAIRRGDRIALTALKDQLIGVGMASIVAGGMFLFVFPIPPHIQKNLLHGIIVIFVMLFMMHLHRGLLRRVAKLKTGNLARYTALIVPPAIGLAWLFITFTIAVRKVSSEELFEIVFKALMSAFGMYMIATLIAYGMVRQNKRDGGIKD